MEVNPQFSALPPAVQKALAARVNFMTAKRGSTEERLAVERYGDLIMDMPVADYKTFKEVTEALRGVRDAAYFVGRGKL